MEKNVVKEIVLGGIVGAALFLGSYFVLKTPGVENAFNRITEYVQSQNINEALKEGAEYVSIKVKKGDTIHDLTFDCYGRPNGEDSKLDSLKAVLESNGLENTLIHPNQELYIPFNKNNAGDLEYCLSRAEKEDEKPVIYKLHFDNKGRHYLLPEKAYSQIEDLVKK